MKKRLRIILFLAGAAVLFVIGWVAYFFLLANDIITFTKKTQSIELPQGRILNIYRTSTWEYYDCKFELRERAGKVLIPKTRFYWTAYFSAGSPTSPGTATVWSTTSEWRTTFVPLIGEKSGIIGLVSSDDVENILLLVDPAKSTYVAASPSGLSEEEKDRGEELLLRLKSDYPLRELVLSGSRSD